MLLNKPLRDHHPFVQLMLIFSLCLSSAGLFTLLAFQLAEPITGIPATISPDWLLDANPAYIPYIWWVQAMSGIGLFVLPGLLWAYYYDHQTAWAPLGFQYKWQADKIFVSLMLVISTAPLIYTIYYYNQQLALPESWSSVQAAMEKAEEESEKTIALLLEAKGFYGLFFNLLVIALLPAIGEELLFRGTLQPLFGRFFKNQHAAIWFTAFLFSALHMQWFGFLPRMLLGALFGYLYYYSGFLLLPVLAHLANNGLAVLSTYLQPNAGLEDRLLHSPWWLILLSIVVSLGLMWYIYSHRNLKNAPTA